MPFIADGSVVAAIRNANRQFEQGPIACPLFTPEELITNDAGSDFESNKASGEDAAFLQYTSGSTSAPRGVMISHANVLSNLKSLASSFGAPPGAVGVSWLPLAHDLGLIGNLLLFLYTGGELVLMTPLAFIGRPVRWFKAISRFRAWGTSAPNFALALCERVIRKSELEDVDLSCLEALFCGAELIEATTLEKFSYRSRHKAFAVAFWPADGLAEATPLSRGPNLAALVQRLIPPRRQQPPGKTDWRRSWKELLLLRKSFSGPRIAIRPGTGRRLIVVRLARFGCRETRLRRRFGRSERKMTMSFGRLSMASEQDFFEPVVSVRFMKASYILQGGSKN